MHKRHSRAVFGLAVSALLLLGAAAPPMAYKPLIGAWNCNLPASGKEAWSADLSVTPTSDGKLRLVLQRTSQYGPGGGVSYIWYDDATSTWSYWTPSDPFVGTGQMMNGQIIFTPPAPRPERFVLTLGQDEREMTMLTFDTKHPPLNPANLTILCMRNGV